MENCEFEKSFDVDECNISSMIPVEPDIYSGNLLNTSLLNIAGGTIVNNEFVSSSDASYIEQKNFSHNDSGFTAIKGSVVAELKNDIIYHPDNSKYQTAVNGDYAVGDTVIGIGLDELNDNGEARKIASVIEGVDMTPMTDKIRLLKTARFHTLMIRGDGRIGYVGKQSYQCGSAVGSTDENNIDFDFNNNTSTAFDWYKDEDTGYEGRLSDICNIIDIESSERASFALDSNGYVYGRGRLVQLGIGANDTEAYVGHFIKLPISGIKQIKSNKYVTLFLAFDGKIYATGIYKYCVVGSTSEDWMTNIRECETSNNENVIYDEIHVGDQMFNYGDNSPIFVTDTSGYLWAAGSNSNGNLGIGGTDFTTEFTKCYDTEGNGIIPSQISYYYNVYTAIKDKNTGVMYICGYNHEDSGGRPSIPSIPINGRSYLFLKTNIYVKILPDINHKGNYSIMVWVDSNDLIKAMGEGDNPERASYIGLIADCYDYSFCSSDGYMGPRDAKKIVYGKYGGFYLTNSGDVYLSGYVVYSNESDLSGPNIYCIDRSSCMYSNGYYVGAKLTSGIKDIVISHYNYDSSKNEKPQILYCITYEDTVVCYGLYRDTYMTLQGVPSAKVTRADGIKDIVETYFIKILKFAKEFTYTPRELYKAPNFYISMQTGITNYIKTYIRDVIRVSENTFAIKTMSFFGASLDVRVKVQDFLTGSKVISFMVEKWKSA